jgi:hypothetical protein
MSREQWKAWRSRQCFPGRVIADHRERIGKPAISAEGFSGLPCTLLVARCHSRELQAGKTVDRRNLRHLRPACFGIRTDDSDTNFLFGSWLPPLPTLQSTNCASCDATFADSPDKVRLSDFRFRLHKEFEYVYDLGDKLGA